jgi:hypothetical protein
MPRTGTGRQDTRVVMPQGAVVTWSKSITVDCEAHTREVRQYSQKLPENSHSRRAREAIAAGETRIAERLRPSNVPTTRLSTTTRYPRRSPRR